MPLQKEVIHLAIGTLPHHVTTHFFNQQTSHFDYSNRGEGNEAGPSSRALLDPTVDFQEGTGALNGQPTFFPRQVVIDFRDNLGRGWDAYNAVYGYDGDDDIGDDSRASILPEAAPEEGLRAWHRPAEVYLAAGKVQGPQRHLRDDSDYEDDDNDEEVYDDDDTPRDTSDDPSRASRSDTATTVPSERNEKSTTPSKGTQLSQSLTPADYAHNSHHPRGVRALPRYYQSGTLASTDAEPSEGHVPFSSFEMGMSLAQDMERDSSLLDDHIRRFAEDSDLLQAFNLYASISDGFAGIAHETLELLADDYSKTPVVAWGIASTRRSQDENIRRQFMRQTNEILSLWSLSSSALYVPMEVPQVLRGSKSGQASSFKRAIDWSLPYNAAALFASFIDTTLLPTRLHDEAQRRPTSTLTSTLNWRRDTPIARIGGCMPIPLLAPVREASKPLDPIEALLASRGYDTRKRERQGLTPYESAEERAKRAAQTLARHNIDLSPGSNTKSHTYKAYAQAAVARDSDHLADGPTREALEAWLGLDEPSGRVDVLPIALNVRSASMPQLFRNLTSTGRPLPDQQGPRRKVETLPMTASLCTSPATAKLLADARRFVDERLVRGHESLYAYGLGGTRGRSGAGQAASDDTEGPLGGRDGMQEVRERLEELLGAYDDGDAHNGLDEDCVGTDEEVDAGDDSDWDLGD